MRGPGNRLLNWLAPKVCPSCEGGSGAVYDCDRGTLVRCDVCEGTGRASDELSDRDFTRLLRKVFARKPASPRSAA